MLKTTCSKCNKTLDTKGRYCKSCHAAYMRATRPKFIELNTEQKRKATARALLNDAKRHGRIITMPCNECGEKRTQAHHNDYSKPLEVVWLCKDCHLEFHRKLKIS